jgi:hypothetical protein
MRELPDVEIFRGREVRSSRATGKISTYAELKEAIKTQS